MTRFPPSTSSVVTVPMTRTAYAQLMGQKFNAPRIFRRPLDQTADEARWWDNGVKIACGFEMLYQEARTRKEGLHVSGSNEMLEHAQYFEDELRDSKRWKEKEKEAAKRWISMRQADDTTRASFADLVNDAINSHPDAMLRDEGEDPDDWLNVAPMDVEQTVHRYQKHQYGQDPEANDAEVVEGGTEEDKVAIEQAHKLKRLAEKMEGFVEGEGALEGALFEDELDLDSDDDNEEGEDIIDSDDAKARRQAAMDALVPPLEPGEYGKMPPQYRHPNTQAVTPYKVEKVDEDGDDEMVSGEPKAPDTSSSARSLRRPVFQRDRFDGVDSDDETTDEEDNILGSNVMRNGEDDDEEEEEEDRPQIVGDVEIDMEQEEEDFLRFSKEALGIDDATWESIIADREKRGAYLPPSMKRAPKAAELPPFSSSKGPSAARFFDEIPQIAVTPRPPRNKPGSTEKTKSDAREGRVSNPNLDSFEAVMDAMEKELERLKSTPNHGHTPNETQNWTEHGNEEFSKRTTKDVKGKGKGRVTHAKREEEEENDEDEDEDAEMMEMQHTMDLELRSKLKRNVEVVSSEDEDSEVDMPMDYTLIKNFLESFKAQQGLAGPVGGLAGRLQGSDWAALPRDG
ncbi:hypothetical protein FRC17_005341 [Serendipita sp. 399]|nr:hypothetical protein FRC17_005341 [Serendipita sp. 399]